MLAVAVAKQFSKKIFTTLYDAELPYFALTLTD
jgi:hypothetical protein